MSGGGNMKRCFWAENTKYPNMREYHDTEWGVPSHNDRYIFEMMVLELFHTGLSWQIVLNKRDAFKEAFDNFEPNIVKNYQEGKVLELLENKGIIRHRRKIEAAINNAVRFLEIQQEFGSFSNYIWSFTNNSQYMGDGLTIEPKNTLSDNVAKDLKKRGFRWLGSVTTMSFLEAIGVVNHHMENCFRYHK